MDQDLPQASRLSQIRNGDNEPINILASLFFISVVSLANLYDATMSAFFFALVFMATSTPNLVPGKAEEYSRIKMAIDFLVDLLRVRKSYGPLVNEPVSSSNWLVIASCPDNGNLKALSRWKTVSVFFEFLFKIRKFSKQSNGRGSEENQLVVYSHQGNQKVKTFSRWRTVSAFFEFFFKIRKYTGQPKKNCGSRENTLAVYSPQQNQTVKAISRWKTVSAFFEFLYKMKKYCREAKENGAVPSFGPLVGYNSGETENQFVISSRLHNERVKASNRWKVVSAFFEFMYKIKTYRRSKKDDRIPSYGLSIIKDTQKSKYHEGGFDTLYKSYVGHYQRKRINKQLMICYRQEDKRLIAFNRWRAISRLFEFIYKIRKFYSKGKNGHIASSSGLPMIEGTQKDECLGGVAPGDVPEAFSKRDHQLASSSHQESDSTKLFNRWRRVALSFEFLYKIRNSSSEEFKKDYESTPYNPPVIKNWQKGKRLGSGAFGAVYEACTETGFFFALKEVPLLNEDKRFCEKIAHAEWEISILSKFRHENIVRYLGSKKDDANFYIFLELVSQGSISQLYKTYHLSDSQASRYARDILRGLCYLHSHNVVHRDIKGDNVLVDIFGTAKLADFGLAKVTNPNDTKSSKGTPYWMAPEIVDPRKCADDTPATSADIWSFGCTVLEMLTRQHPYHGMEPWQAMFRIGKGEVPPIPTAVSSHAREFIQRCLQVNPKDRPTAAELLCHPFINNLTSSTSA